MRMLGLFAGCLAFVAGCTDDVGLGGAASGVTSGSGVGGSGGLGGAGGSGDAGDSVTFIVVESDFGEPSAPRLEGATVAFDAPGGARVEKVTGVDGKVTFTGIHWSKGKAAATAYLEGHALWSSVNLDEARLAKAPRIDDAVPLLLFSTTATEMVTVKGTLTGLMDTAHLAEVNVVGTNVVTQDQNETGAETFTVTVPKGAPFTLQAFEESLVGLPSGQGHDVPIYQVMEQTFGAAPDDISGLVLDFAGKTLATKTVDVSVATPTRADSPVRAAFGDGCVAPSNSEKCTGWETHIDISADKNQFDATLLWTEPGWAKDPRYILRVRQGGTFISVRYATGWPKPGSIGALPDTALWVTPADTSGEYPLHDAMEWKLFDADVPHVRLRLYSVAGVAWQVDAGPDATSLTVPEPPSPVDATSLFGASLGGILYPSWFDETTYQLEAFSASLVVLFTP